METEVATCAQCGAQMQPGDAKCPLCGAASGTPSEAAPATAAAPATEAAPTWVAPQPPPSPYRFSGKVSLGGVLGLLLISLIGAVVVGAVYHYIADHVDLVLVEPAIGGFIVGGFVILGIRAVHCRNVPVAIAIGLLSGVVFYGTRLVLDSQEMRPMIVQLAARSFERDYGMSKSTATARAETILDPWHTVKDYLQLEAFVGVTLTNSNHTSYSDSTSSGSEGGDPSDLKLQGVWFWGLLAVEAAIASLIIAGMARTTAFAVPYCESCAQWMKPAGVVKRSNSQAGEMMQYVNGRAWDNLAAIPQRGPMDGQHFASTTLYACSKCDFGALSVFARSKNAIKRLLLVQVEGDAVPYLKGKLPPVKGSNI